ncbi:MAG: hypothetical protein WA799_00390 [Nitrosotalea sp.]
MSVVKAISIIASIIAAAFFGAFLATLSPDYGKPIMFSNMELKPHQQPTFPNAKTNTNPTTPSPSNEIKSTPQTPLNTAKAPAKTALAPTKSKETLSVSGFSNATNLH